MRSLFFNYIFVYSLFCISPICNLFPAEQDYRFRHIAQEQGLSQNTVNCIFQDSRGFLWLGTGEGLNKFDGYDFEIFAKGKPNCIPLIDDNIQSIYEDNNQILWFGTENGGIYKYNRTLDLIEQIKLDSLPLLINNRNRIRSIIEDQQGDIWFIAGNAIIHLTQATNSIKAYIPDPKIKELNVIFQDSFNNYWIGTDEKGLAFFNEDDNTFRFYKNNASNVNSINDNEIKSIYEDSEKNLWIGTYNGGLNLFDIQNNRFKNFIPDIRKRESRSIKSIEEDDDGNLWLGTRNGLYIFNRTDEKFDHFKRNSENPFSLSHNNIQTVFFDTEGNFWVGTKGGLNFLNKKNINITHYKPNNKNKGLSGSTVLSLLEDEKNNIWFGTEDGGLNKLDVSTGNISHYKNDPNNKSSISDDNINALTKDKNGNIWIGTYQGGLNLFNIKNQKFTRYILHPDKLTDFQYPIYASLADDYNKIWLGTDGGLVRFDIISRKITYDSLNQITQNLVINCMAKDSNMIWLGSRNNKIYKVNSSTLDYKIYQIPSENDFTWITSICVDDSNLWIGTKGNGLYYFNEKKNKFHHFTTNDGLCNNNILGILVDNLNDIWVSTQNGLSKYNLLTKTFTNFKIDDGLQNNEFSSGYLRASSGCIYLGDIDGAISFIPELFVSNSRKYPIYLTEFKLFNKEVKIGNEGGGIISSHINGAKEISLSHNQSSFTFAYAALNLDFNNNIEYEYMMEGFENDWNFVGKRRYATYTNLNPGNYNFKVRTINNNKEISANLTSVLITISPPYWQTWWFRLAIITIFFFIIRHIVNYYKQKRDLLKATVLANHTQLKLLRNQMNPHFLFNALSVSRALILVDKDKAWDFVSKVADYFRYVLLSYSDEKNTLTKEIEAVKNYLSIQKASLSTKIEVSSNIDSNIPNLIVPTFILQPLVENAIKYGNQGNKLKINISISYINEILSIDISNTGKINPSSKKFGDSNSTNGTSIINIKKRLDIMFNENYTLKLYEEDGWVHATIKIKYYV